jgi:inward rectifier potassium channel
MALFAKKPPEPNRVKVIGVRATPIRDLYHLILRAPWSLVLTGWALVFLSFNTFFAAIYDAVGGVAGLHDGSFHDYFFFSVQTMATIGYGSMYPVSTTAHLLVTSEAVVGMTLLALTTGIMFSKFAGLRARIQFARDIVIAPLDGIPTLQIRLGNERTSQIIDAVVRVVLYRTEVSIEGVKLYRMYDLALERERAPALSRSWTVLHRIRAEALLSGATPESLVKDEIEFLISVTGIDELTGQTMHARHMYDGAKLVWGARHADLLSELADGTLQLDMTQFHDTVPTKPQTGFPYPR